MASSRPTSTIPAFRAALIETLKDRAGLQGVQITDGPPPPAVLEGKEFIALMRARGEQSIRAMARTRQPREERYLQEIEISVVALTRTNQVTIGERAFALLAEIEDAIREAPSLAGVFAGRGQLVSVVLGPEDYQTFATDQQRESRINVGLNVHARV